MAEFGVHFGVGGCVRHAIMGLCVYQYGFEIWLHQCMECLRYECCDCDGRELLCQDEVSLVVVEAGIRGYQTSLVKQHGYECRLNDQTQRSISPLQRLSQS
jgi:hypothetical protein